MVKKKSKVKITNPFSAKPAKKKLKRKDEDLWAWVSPR